MTGRLASFFGIFLIALIAFLCSTHFFMKDTADREAFVSAAFFTQLQRSFGDIDFAEPSEMSNGVIMWFMTVMYFIFAFFMVILMMNLMVAIMSEAIVEVSANAKARWCQNQHSMLQRLREDKSELLPWLCLRCARFWYNSMYSIIMKYWTCCCCCCCKGLRKGEVWYTVDMKWDNEGNRAKDGRSAWAGKVDKLRAKIAFDSLEYNHMRLQFNYGDRLAAEVKQEIKKTVDQWMVVDKQFHKANTCTEKKDDTDGSEGDSEKTKLGDIPERFSAIMNGGVDHAGWIKFVEDCNTRYRSLDRGHDPENKSEGFEFWPEAAVRPSVEKGVFMSRGCAGLSGRGEEKKMFMTRFDDNHPLKGLKTSRQDSRRASSFCNMFSARLRVSLIWCKFQEDKQRREQATKSNHYLKTVGCTHAKEDPLFVPAGGLFLLSGFQSFHLLYQLSKYMHGRVDQLAKSLTSEAGGNDEQDHDMPKEQKEGKADTVKEAPYTHPRSSIRPHFRPTSVLRRHAVSAPEEHDQEDTEDRGWRSIKKDCFRKALTDLFKYVIFLEVANPPYPFPSKRRPMCTQMTDRMPFVDS